MSSSEFIIIGGGMVAGYAAKELATRGLKSGQLTIISSDTALPYERPPLSKGFLLGKETEASILINSSDFYREQGIDVRLQTSVNTIDLSKHRVVTSANDELSYEKLLLATGARPRTLDVPGAKLDGVFYLRSMDDSRAIRERAEKSKQAVVIGSGFIGMEVASVLAQKNIRTTMIIREDRVWRRVFTPEMSAFFERYYSDRGVQLMKSGSLASIEGKHSVASAVLKDGRELPFDMVVAGVGAVPVTELAAKSGLQIENGVVVNEYLETSAAAVSAAGDIANYFDSLFQKRRRVEHWDNAVSQGQHWARVVTGDRRPFVHVPYFFSDIFDLSYELWGDSDGATENVVRGDMQSAKFSVWWLKDDRLIAAFVMNRPDEERQLAPQWIEAKKKVSPKVLADSAKPLQDALR
ncbi:MAG TPA: FAD/NAD(P)-binding oxidoreductase [Candidatus Acidoferrales bacterium]|nr:FAD/NAD(P)-binding oxidoreductase [Candidatus Acidoferrales bacterium]